jgi:chromosome segregation ATPase
MSDGKKFGPKSLASAEERLADVEQKFSVIQQRIQAYDAVLDEFRSLKSELKGNKKTIESFVAATSSIFDELSLKVNTYGAQFQILHSKGESNAKALDEHKNYVSKFVATHNKIYQDFNEVIAKIKESLAVSFDQKNQITNSFAEFQNSLATIKSWQASTTKALEKLTDDHIKFKDATAVSQAETAKDQAKLSKAIASLPSLQEWANNLYGRVQQDAAYREKQATAYVDKKITDLAKDFDANPLSAQSVRNELFNEIQALALDGKNAYLKSNNCATQLALLEKKLENLNLIIKKYELNR